ncbi:unnamed protein product [Prorocentrum cordatum]|uniref:Uncharacterized protein n=1 Tax=Prorocentrum cordatum TaxID=2364126 RepID=A0ABN9PIE1_9DINO|nr:unnamed protein product [Polarella glacialis]
MAGGQTTLLAPRRAATSRLICPGSGLPGASYDTSCAATGSNQQAHRFRLRLAGRVLLGREQEEAGCTEQNRALHSPAHPEAGARRNWRSPTAPGVALQRTKHAAAATTSRNNKLRLALTTSYKRATARLRHLWTADSVPQSSPSAEILFTGQANPVKDPRGGGFRQGGWETSC